jgi:hypothetical protein
MANKKNDNNAPAWARYNGETYKSGFSGTPEQKKASDKALAELLSKRNKKKSGGGK